MKIIYLAINFINLNVGLKNIYFYINKLPEYKFPMQDKKSI